LTPRPDFFIVGAPKCGTSSLYRYLSEHPEIFMAHPKEPQFFAADRVARFGMRYPDDMERYLSLFADAGAARRGGEASTSYFEAPPAPGRILDFAPAARIIVMLRDPIDMIDSLHGMRVMQGYERKAELEAALADEKTRPGFGVIGDQRSVRYRDRARFGQILPKWFEAFGRERVHVIILEEFAADPDAQFRGVLEFLDVDPSHMPTSFERHNVSRRPRSAVLAGIDARLPHRVVPRTTADRLTVPLARVVRRLNRRPAPRPPVPEPLRQKLEREFAPDVARVSELLGRDLAQLWWRSRGSP
jgi:hypothetical protein